MWVEKIEEIGSSRADSFDLPSREALDGFENTVLLIARAAL